MTTSSDEADTRCYALVPAAGRGERAGTRRPKQYERVAGRPVIVQTLGALAQVRRIARTLVVLAPDDGDFAAMAPDFGGWWEPCGGTTRAASVRAGLEALQRRGARRHDWVLVHDAARCLVLPAAADRLIDACLGDEVGGLLALPLADTLKDADAQGRVRATVDRGGKWVAQTPQMFRLGVLARALDQAGDAVTDESAAVEALGLAPKLVPGDADNFKLTWPEDFARAERVLAARRLEETTR
jgi:2-C-methyl-D-erythritol 4-phosphate cytidylyltransferase